MGMKIDWLQVERFRIVGRFQNVSRAADELGTSQPALSRAIARLEERLGVPLFHRAGRSLRLTSTGEAFLKTIESAYGTIEEAQHCLTALPGPSKPIRLGFVRTLGVRLVPSLVSDYQRRPSSGDFTFMSNNVPALEDLLQRDELDLIFTSLPTRGAALVSHKIIDQELILIAPKDTHYAGEPLTLKDFSNEPFITFSKGHFIRTVSDLLCNTAGFIPKVKFEVSDSGSIPGFVAAGLGASIVPRDGNVSRDVAIVPMRFPLMMRPMGLAWIEGRHLHASARGFKAYIMSLGKDAATALLC